MRIDLSYNDVNLELYVSNRKLDQDKMSLIRHKTFEFFDSIQEIFMKEEIASKIENPTYADYTIISSSPKLSEITVTPFSVKEAQKEIADNPEVRITDINTINELTGDKRVGKKRFEDIPSEELGTDVRGMPWNPEIHAATKAKRKDGTWKLKKGANLIQSAEKEKQILQDLPPPPPSNEVVEIKNREIPKTFNEMMNLIDEIIDTGRIDTTGVMKILADLGFNSILHLRDNIAMYDKVYAQFHSALGGVL